MSLDTLMVHTVTLVTPASITDAYGNTTTDYGVTATRTSSKGWVAQADASEQSVDRSAQIADWKVYLPITAAVTGASRIEWGSIVLEVVGPPNRAWTPKGEHHVEANARAVTG